MRQLEMYIYYNRWSKMITITTSNQDFGNYISKAAHIFSILVGGGVNNCIYKKLQGILKLL